MLHFYTDQFRKNQLPFISDTNNVVIHKMSVFLEGNINTQFAHFNHQLLDHKCSSDEFQCDNGQCVMSSLRCDGDVACLDESDEKDCACLSNEFKCNDGLCLHLTKLCDGQKDCSEGSDEANCGKDHLQLICRLSINIHIPYIIQSTDSDSVQDKW